MTNAQDIIVAYLAAFNRGDWAGMLALLTDDVVHEINQGGVEQGKPAFAVFLDRMAQCYREELNDIVIMAGPDGARAAAEFRVEGQYLAADPGLPGFSAFPSPIHAPRGCMGSGCNAMALMAPISRWACRQNALGKRCDPLSISAFAAPMSPSRISSRPLRFVMKWRPLPAALGR
jgi:steroid delta-isomerase-like uncharacterized protein